mgnify:CR=1 FL=1
MELIEITKASFQKMQEEMDKRFDQVQAKLDNFRIEFNQRFDFHETRLNRIESNMVKKEDFNHLFRSLTRVLSEKELLTETESRYFLSQTQD